MKTTLLQLLTPSNCLHPTLRSELGRGAEWQGLSPAVSLHFSLQVPFSHAHSNPSAGVNSQDCSKAWQ